MDKLIINVAMTGMVPTRKDTPHVPLSVEEIVADAKRCWEAGASILHLHARDEKGSRPIAGTSTRRSCGACAAACPDIILCVSTSGRVFKSFEERSEVLDCVDPAPEMASLTLGSMNFPKVESVNSPTMIASLARKMQERGIVPEWEAFDMGMVDYANYLVDHGILKPPFYCNFLLGSLGTLSATRVQLGHHRARPAQGRDLGGGGDRTVPIPDQPARDRHGRATCAWGWRTTCGTMRAHRARDQPGAGGAAGEIRARGRDARWPRRTRRGK